MNGADLIATAKAMAAHAHSTQRYGERPYTVHLAAAVAVLRRFGLGDDPEVVAATWLHDAIEDTDLTREAIASALGERVAAMVDAVTDGPGENRTQRKARPYQVIPQTPDAVLVKLADRIANVESALENRPGLVRMYRREHPTFREKLYTVGVADEMWAHLDGLISG
ncbi:MAG: HD domain-containing protein [Myxococcota bacterium]